MAQLTDDFADGDFTANPTWSGTTSSFIVNGSKQLQLSNSVAGTSYLTTSFVNADLSQFNVEWQLYVKQTFSPSGSNYGRVYLVSDQSDLTQPLNGYYLQFGEAGSNDAIELFRQSGTTRVSICRATNGAIAASFAVRVKVLRSSSGNWQLFADYNGGSTFLLQASSNENTNSASLFAGIECVYTLTNAAKFFYDDFSIVSTPIPDVTPPTLLSATFINGSTLDVVFSEPLNSSTANSISNYSIDQSIGNPASATLQSDNRTVRLTFSNSFVNGRSYNVSVLGIKDLVGNDLVSTSQNVLYFIPTAAQVKDVVINEFFPDPSPVIGLPDQEFVELYNRSNSPFDLSGWKLTDRSSTATLPSQIILPNEYWIITSSSATALYSPIGKTLGVANFPTLNNSGDKIILIDPTGLKIDSLTYNSKWYNDADKQQGGWSIELLNPDTLRYDSANWLSSLDPTGGTPGKQNSQFGNRFDQTPPVLNGISVASQSELQLIFNEALQATSVADLNKYSIINSSLKPILATLSVDKKTITLQFSIPFLNGIADTLNISGLSDLAGNIMTSVKKEFLYFKPSPIQPKDIIITEFMADPTPVVGLPEAEFIEIYNRSENPINLFNWTLTDGSSIAKFPAKIIQPDDYWIVASSSVSQLFTSFGKVFGLSGFPSLNNSGDKIVLADSSGQKIDSLVYSLKWFNDADKQQGGWSLELLNTDTLRYDSANWLPSVDPTGGTPGKKNSQFGNHFDQTPPALVNVSAANDHQLVLLFNEKLDVATAETAGNYVVNNEVGQPITSSLSTDKKTVTLTFQKIFKNGFTNSISISGVSDVSRNTLQNTLKEFLYFVSQPVSAKDIVITEIMADPSPVVGLPEVEYIEIYNRSTNAIDLLNWTLSDGSTVAKFPSRIIQPNEYWIVHPSTTQAFSNYANRIALVSFPSLNNSSDSIVLKNSLTVTIDSVAYSSDWYKNTDKSEGGWSLELIDPQNICGEENNWAASEDLKGGTPGKQNSVNANKPDLIGPKLLSIVAGSDQLLLAFDEKLEKMILPDYFSIAPDRSVVSAAVHDKALREIELKLNAPLSRRQLYSLEVNDLADCNGNVVQEEFSRLTFALPEQADSLDVLVNEILFNPRPNGTDFIEIYNNSPKYINLKNWKLANVENGIVKNATPVSDENFILNPNTYLAISENPDVVKNDYPNNPAGNFLASDLPSFPDDAGSAVLITSEGKIIDQFLYSKAFHSPLIKDDEGVSLERISFSGSTQDPNNWKSASSTTGFATPGYLNSNARPEAALDESSVLIEPEIFSPDSGPEFARINYRFDQSSFLANVKIFDQQGRLIKTIANNQSLPYEGSFRWDGDREDGSKARMGYYTVWFEVFDTSGFLKTFRKRVVVAGN